MFKQILATTVALVAMVGMAAIPDDSASAEKEEVTICHRTNSIKNPYTVNKVDADSVDGDAGNDNGQGDHYLEHKGPVANPATMTNGDDWGDIIPPIDGVHDGLNWSTEGQAIYRNGCNYPGETEFNPNTTVSAVCDVANQVVRLTFTNTGNAASSVSVNGASSTVAAGATVNVTTPITGATVTVNVVIDGQAQTVTVSCPTGGSGTVTQSSTPGTPAVAVRGGGAGAITSLPVTSSGNQAAAAITLIVSSLVAAISTYLTRARSSLQF